MAFFVEMFDQGMVCAAQIVHHEIVNDQNFCPKITRISDRGFVPIFAQPNKPAVIVAMIKLLL